MIFVTNDTGTELERQLNFVLRVEQATNYSNLTMFVDYVIAGLQQTYSIRPNMFRVPIAFVLRGDGVFEEDEAVTVRILPDRSSPITARIRVPDANSDVFPVTTVIIRDSEGELWLYVMVFNLYSWMFYGGLFELTVCMLV